jgi:hypothetical protein
MDSGWTPGELQVNSGWTPGELWVNSSWTPDELQKDSNRSPTVPVAQCKVLELVVSVLFQQIKLMTWQTQMTEHISVCRGC